MDSEKKKKTLTQVERAERLQDMWLQWMEDAMAGGSATSTDMATLARVLMSNGWSLDKSKLPSGLADKLTDRVAFDDDMEGETRMRVLP